MYDKGVRVNDVYTITPNEEPGFKVFCDIENGGWTVVQVIVTQCMVNLQIRLKNGGRESQFTVQSVKPTDRYSKETIYLMHLYYSKSKQKENGTVCSVSRKRITVKRLYVMLA